MKNLKSLSYGVVAGVSTLMVPAVSYAKSFKDIVDKEVVPFGDKIISLLYALAFLVFLIGMVRLFFSDNAESREKGKYFAIYGIIGLVALFAVWGFVRVMLGVLGSFNT